MVPKNKKAYYEGIPLTTAEGSSTIEDIDMETIGSMKSSKDLIVLALVLVYGVINLFAREIPMDEFQTKSTTTYGSFGL
jgi:iron complex outermembrane receptor protein